MSDCIIAMRSMTLAQKAERILASNGIRVDIVNIEPSLTKRGCGYGLTLSCYDMDKALDLMKRKRVSHGEIIGNYR